MEARLAALPLAVRQQIQGLTLALGGPDTSASTAPPPAPAAAEHEEEAMPATATAAHRPFPVTFLRPDPLIPAALSVAAEADARDYLTAHGRQGGLAGGASDAGVRGDTAAFVDRRSTSFAASFPALAAAIDALLSASSAALVDAGLVAGSPTRTSIQVAAYASGSPGYALHTDGGPGAPGRVATAILYLGARSRPPGAGGELVLYAPCATGAPGPSLTVPPAGGRALAWAASTPHEVLPVKAGPRRVAVSVFFYGQPGGSVLLPAPRPPQPAQQANGRIFIAIPAFRDADARWTIHSAFTAASHPDRLSVGIAWQVELPADSDIVTPVGSGAWPGRVREVRVPASEATGPASARRLAIGLLAGEEFVLSIDAHTRFRQGWDGLLLQWWRDGGGDGDPRLVLTTYPPPHEGWGAGAAFPSHDVRPTVLCADRFGGTDGMLRCAGRRLARTAARPIPCHFYGAGLAFAPASLFTSVAPYDAWMDGAFFGEEADVWVRAASAGWRAAAPPEAAVSTCYETADGSSSPGGHRRGRPPPRTAGAAAAWATREAAVMRGEEGGDLAAFRARLGGVRTVAEVWAAAGVDWVGKSISEAGKWGGLGAAAFAT